LVDRLFPWPRRSFTRRWLSTMANQSPKGQISPKANRQKSEKGFLPKAAKETKVLVWICYELE
jgi:hypothetical protein